MEKPSDIINDDACEKIIKRNVCMQNKKISKKTLARKKLVKVTVSTKRRMNKKSRPRNVTEDSVFGFSIHTSSSDTLPMKAVKCGLKKTRVITSESPSREGNGTRQKRKTQTFQRSHSGALSNESSSTSKKSVTWGSETRHQYHETSPVHCNRKVKVSIPNSFFRLGYFCSQQSVCDHIQAKLQWTI